MIHTFGDSHSWNGFEKMPGINIHHLGPKLMHSVGRDGLDILNIKNFSVNDGDYVIFSFGEIDCRCHIKKYCNDENDYTKIIDNIINNYALTVEMNSNLITDVKICLYNVPPPLKRCYVSGYGMVLLDPNYEFRFTASDEERQMYKVKTYGSSFGTYDTKLDTIALKRGALSASFFFTIPGPKMVWQFGELGYDYSINYCPSTGLVDATGTCRTDPKPGHWDYYTDPQRLKLFNIYSQLIRLKQYYPVFSTTDYTTDLTGITKSIVLRSAGLNAVVVGNFGVTGTIASVTFPSTGTYYDYFSNSTLNVSNANQSLNLNPGEYHIYTNAMISGIGDNSIPVQNLEAKVFPNPTSGEGTIEITRPASGEATVDIYSMTGQKLSSSLIRLQPNSTSTLYLNKLGFNTPPPGIYLLKVIQGAKSVNQKLIFK